MDKALQLTDYTGIPEGGMRNIAVIGGSHGLAVAYLLSRRHPG